MSRIIYENYALKNFSPDDDQSTLPKGSFAAGQPARLVKIVASQLGIQDSKS